MLAGFEDEVEVARVFGIDAEIVDGPFRVGFGVGGEPAFCWFVEGEGRGCY